MKRASAGFLLFLTFVAYSTSAIARICSPPHSVYGLVGDKWRALGAGDGPLGCPTSEEMDDPEGSGRYQIFEYGAVAWSPNTGQRSVQAAYLTQEGITVEWGDTSPFNYDVFLVRWDKDGQNIGQQDVSGGNRTGGKWTIPYSGLGRYRIVIEGCDRHTFSSSTCRQGWSNPVYVTYTGTPLHGTPAQGAPFDLVARSADPMGFPLNAAWAVQLANPGAGWPSADQACFDVHYGKREAHFERCTTQVTRQDTVDGWHAVTCDYGATSPVHGHVNWHVGTYTGRVYWMERDWPDGDYNFLLATPGDAAVTVSNPSHLMKMEFDSDETVDNFQTPWWTTLRRFVDDDDDDAIIHWMGGKQTIAIGLVGLDCVHDCASELHPLYAIAMNVKEDDADDVWAMFVRNWGNEGWCSHYRHLLRKNDFVFRLPWKPGASGVTVLNTGDDRFFLTNDSQVSGPNVTAAVGQGVDVAFHLPEPEAEARINGELHLHWTFPSSLQNRIKTSTEVVRPKSVVKRSALQTGRGSEEQMHTLFNRLPAVQKKNLRIATTGKPGFDNLPVRVTVNSIQALRSVSVVSIARVDVKEDTAKAERDQRRLQALCAAYNNRPPDMENACPKSIRPLTRAPLRKAVPKPLLTNPPVQP